MGQTPLERDGAFLRRPARPWNAAVHALLRHLEIVGFSGAPRSLAIEDDGRHKLTWVVGEAGSSTGDPDTRLISSARLIRRYHEAVRGFPTPVGLESMVGAPKSGPIVCHNDLGPVNTVFTGTEAIALIDWDLAGPGHESWDLAYAAWRTVPLYDDMFFLRRNVAPPDRLSRLRLFVDAYGLEERDGFVALICERIRSLYDTARLWGGEEGRYGWRDAWRDTKGRQWLGSLAYAEANAARWTEAVTE